MLKGETVYENIGPLDEPLQCIEAFSRIQVQGNTTLAGVIVEEQGAPFRVRATLRERPDPASRVSFRRFYLDDIGPHIRQHLGTIWPCHHRGQLHNLEAIESVSSHRDSAPWQQQT
jgi:hypothetical protein